MCICVHVRVLCVCVCMCICAGCHDSGNPSNCTTCLCPPMHSCAVQNVHPQPVNEQLCLECAVFSQSFNHILCTAIQL